MSRIFVRCSFVVGFLAVISLIAAGCGGGGGGTTAGLGGGAEQWRLTAVGFIDETGAPQPAPAKLEAPDRLEAPAIPGVGYNVRAVNGATGQTLATAISDTTGHWSLSFSIPKDTDMAIILVATKDTVTMRAILPLESQGLATLASQAQYSISMAVPISMQTENKVKELETALGITVGNLGKVALPAEVTAAAVCDKAITAGFILMPEGIFTFTGDVDTSTGLPPTFSVGAGTAQYNKAFGSTVNLAGAVTALTGSLTGRNLTYKWTQTAGPTGALSNATSPNATFTTASLAANLAFDQNYVTTNFPGSQARPDRFGIVPLTAQQANYNFVYTLKLTVTDTDSGNTASATVQVFHLARQPGLNNVGVGLALLLNAPGTGSFNWSLSTPAGSSAALNLEIPKNPYFIPDKTGTYVVTESGKSLTIYAGTWTGIKADVNGIMASGNNGCLTCHNGTIAQNLAAIFTEWRETPHAKLFAEELDYTGTDAHYSASCTGCHTVGYELAGNNGGFDDLITSLAYTFPPAPNTKTDNYANLVAKYPALAALGSIECENCHGPSKSEGHMSGLGARVSTDSAVCGVCHGRPASHNRIYLWAQSGHANAELAVSEGTSASCGRCHSAQGFIAWQPQIKAATNETQAMANLTGGAPATADNVQPISCVACHDPHSEANANHVRLAANSPFLPAGFQALNVGKGALCMTCHNSRRGLHGDGINWPSSTTGVPSMPHAPSQTDVLMGKNAYFIDPALNYRSPHATTALAENAGALRAMPDTCVTCHMTLVPASPSGSGTNHKFFITADQVCAKCHGEGMNALPLQLEVEDLLTTLMDKIVPRVLNTIKAQASITIQGNPYDATGTLINFTSDALTVDTAKIQSMVFEPEASSLRFIFTFTEDLTLSCAANTNTASCVSYYGDDKSVTTNKVRVSIGNIKAGSPAVALFTQTSDSTLYKAAWNYFLVAMDSSKGVHNRPFALAILNGAIANLP